MKMAASNGSSDRKDSRPAEFWNIDLSGYPISVLFKPHPSYRLDRLHARLQRPFLFVLSFKKQVRIFVFD
jgi:hypothetical protein